MAYNTKPIVTDVDGNPISQYFNPITDSYEPIVGGGGGNAVVLYNKDGTENNSLSLTPILDKLGQLTGTVIDEETRKSNELLRIEFYNQLVNMLNTGQLKGDKGDTGSGLEFNWLGTQLGVRIAGDADYIYVDLRGPEGPQGLPGSIENLTKQHVVNALEYLPVKSVNNTLPDESGNITLEISSNVEIVNNLDETLVGKSLDATQGRTLNIKIGDLTELNTTDKSNLVNAINEVNNKGSGDGVPQGVIVMWSGIIANIPQGWALCDGNNETPNLTDRFIMGATTDATINKTGGQNEVILTEAQIPSHNHSGTANQAGGHKHVYESYDFTTLIDAGSNYVSFVQKKSKETSTDGAHTHTITINKTGGNQAHENRPAYYTLAFIMKL